MVKLRKIVASFLSTAMIVSLIPSIPVSASTLNMTVDISKSTGKLKYGATGWLYGLGNAGIPSDNMISSLKPQVAGQKPPNGLQHPNGDAMEVAGNFKNDGGKQILINIQDIYKEWPYQKLGIDDYLAKVETVVKSVVSNKNREIFVYNPINEPNWIWYGTTGAPEQELFRDWKKIYDKIRSLDKTGKIAGPSLSYYNSQFYKEFMTFCKENKCLPDIITWHELDDNFFTSWDNQYNDFRNIEKGLGLSARPICINEYGRINTDIPVPGQLVQYISKFEKSKVDACLAYWTTAGGLCDLVAAGSSNKPTGAWWLYKCYGEMTGNTVEVTPPDWNTNGFQGVAALDSKKKQARMIFGGSDGNNNIKVKGFDSKKEFGKLVHATIWEIASTGKNASSGPVLKQEGNYPVINGQITVPVSSMVKTSAYQMIITPNKLLVNDSGNSNRYEAEYAALSGSAKISSKYVNYSGTGYVKENNKKAADTKFVVYVNQDGYYDAALRYSAGDKKNAADDRKVKMVINGVDSTNVTCNSTYNWDTWNTANSKVFLSAGINTIEYKNDGKDKDNSINIDYMDLSTADNNSVTSYEAEDSNNTLGGTAKVEEVNNASGGKDVTSIGNGADNYLQFNNVKVSKAGIYKMVVTYANAELGAGASNYNSNIVDRYADISTNNSSIEKVYFRNTLGWDKFGTCVTEIKLNAGNNTIKFSNSSTGFAPNIDKIQIAAPTEELPKPVVPKDIDADKIAKGITSIIAPAKDAESLTLPTVQEGYIVSIKSAAPSGVIGLNGKIKPKEVDTKVSVVLTIKKLKDGTTADTLPIDVIVPAKTSMAASSDATLESISIDGVNLDGFNANDTSYTKELPFGTKNVPQITAVATDCNASLEITQAKTLQGQTQITVTAQDGVTKKTYVVNFKLAAAAVDTYLSDMDWVSATTGWGTIQRDKSLDGNKITLNTTDGIKTFDKGIGVNSPSEIVYDIAGKGFKEFTFTAGRDQEVKANNSKIDFEVLLDGKVVYKLEGVDNSTICQTATINVVGASELKLVVGISSDNSNAYDHGDWADAKLIAGN
ncbi:NPCBM/NEW2 domain-containing protein [Clostridium hydrogenum]|uniref:NPCBM/NEW2 domain-containing protein n=1 Tax=Clostridium hydrogenum TaxID=2855764 RepID=UPI001F45BCF3|nr:NPCBM/NEW2 domain-containing protein [Clostridium hydrogenum]